MRVTPRVSAQHSQFLFGKIEELDHGSIRLPYDRQPGVMDIEVSPAVKEDALAFLRNVLDIWQPAMFPDLEGFALGYGVSPPEDPQRW